MTEGPISTTKTRQFLFPALALFLGCTLALLIAEVTVRLTWDDSQGTPGLVLGHKTRIEVFAPNYEGWFAGQPLKINSLGFRDDREYELEKRENTFRILVLGDSVTFGHGAPFKETWPYLLEQKLKKDNPTIDWQVWNLGVPGYDAVMELRTLEELGPKYEPDLVVIGFYENDIFAWDYHSVGSAPGWVYLLKGELKRRFYLYTKLRFFYNQWKYPNSTFHAKREQHFLKKGQTSSFDLTNFVFKHKEKQKRTPPQPTKPFSPTTPGMFGSAEGYAHWQKAINRFKSLHRSGQYNIVFFINMAPDLSPDDKTYVNGIHNAMNTFYLKELSHPTHAVSSYEAFWSYSPEEVPEAHAHSLGPANLVKADVLFEYLTKEVPAINERKQ